MRGLVANVFPDGLNVHRTDAEFAVAMLPGKIVIPRIKGLNPARRCGFDLFDNFCRRMIFGLRKQEVDVVSDRIDFDKGRIMILENAGDVGMKLTALGIAQQRTPVFGAEHEMHNEVGKGL